MTGRTLILAVAISSGCLQSPLVPCGDISCPPGNVCIAGGCATPADVEACVGLVDGDPCRASNGGAGTCQGGACQTGLCGNGVIDVGEICDGDLGVNVAAGQRCGANCGDVGVVDWIATTAVGSNLAATQVSFADPGAVAVDGSGRMFIIDTANHRALRVEVDGSLETIAGIGVAGYSGDGGLATSAQLAAPAGVAVDGIGRVYIADSGNNVIRRIELNGTITTVAGTGLAGYDPADEGRPAILVKLRGPRGIAVDGLGQLFIADTDNHRIRRVNISGTINSVAGTVQGFAGDNGAATSARLDSPYAVAVDTLDRLVIADTANLRVRRVDTNGTITTIAGNGTLGAGGDNGPATSAQLAFPTGVALDPQGRVVISDTANQKVRRIETNNTITTVAGNGTAAFAGDGGTATSASIKNALGLAVDAQGTIFIADTSNQRIRRIVAGTIDSVAGSGAFGLGAEGGEATSARLSNIYDAAIDSQGRIVIADAFNNRIRRVELDGTISTIAGAGTLGFSGDGGPATAAQLNTPFWVTHDLQGRVVFSDSFNHCVRRVEADGTLTRIVGIGGPSGSGGDNGPATMAQLSQFYGIAYDSTGRLVIADTYNHRIRRVALDGTITTIAGTGVLGYNGDNIAASTAQVAYPYAVAVDAMDRVIIGDTANNRVRRIEANGNIVTIAGTGTAGYNGDNRLATTAQLDGPYGVTLDNTGRVVISDSKSSRIRRIETNGNIVTIAGVGVSSNDGDAAAATSAHLDNPIGIVYDGQGRLVIADTNNSRIRRVEADGTLATVAGQIDPDRVGQVMRARLGDPQAIFVTPTLTLVAGGTTGTLEVIRNGRVEAVGGRYPQVAPTGTLARYRTASFGTVGGVAIDEAAHLIYITETSANRIHVITQVDPTMPSTWTIATLANTAGTAGFADGAAATARFRAPHGLYLDTAAHTLYIADTDNHAIRALDLMTNMVTTVVNSGHRFGFAGDGGLATAALLYGPTALARCPNGDLFIADTNNNRVRRVVPATGIITTVVGDGTFASSGEGTPAHTFPVAEPRGIACDEFGNVFVTSSTAVRMLAANDTKIVDGDGGVFTIYGAPPRTSFPASVTSCLTGIASTGPTSVQVADACTGLLVELQRM